MLSLLLSTILVINEVMSSNAGAVANGEPVFSPAYNFDSWIELYNPGSQAVNLSGWYLSNTEDSLTLWQMPANIGSIAAKGYKVIWLGSNDIKSTQAPFKLDCDGDTIFLSDKSGELVAQQVYPAGMSRTSWARKSVDSDEWGWTANATPGKSNAGAVFADTRLDAPVVSKGSTLFKSSLSITVDIPEGATLMYTTDGSLPAAPGTSGSTSKKSSNGMFTVTNTTNYVFRLFKDGFLPSVPVTRSYIKTSNNYTLPIVSIVGDKRYFTNDTYGFDCDGNGKNGKTGNGQSQPKNYNQDWDRPVNFSYISPEGEMLHNQDVNIKVSGGYTRTLNFRSYKLKASKVFDGQNRYDYSFFPQKPYIRSKTLLLRNGGNDMWRHDARFFDAALETIIQRSGIDIDVQSYVPIIEDVNGELRGVFNLREPNNDDFAYANWGYDDEELDAFENLEIKNGDDVAFKRICELAQDINAEGAYDELKTLLDIDEFTNYMAATLYLYNDDWPDNNLKAYRSRKDGRYRFVSFDLDYAFKGCWGSSWDDPSDNNPFVNFAKFKDDNGPKRNNRTTVPNKEFVNLFLNLLNHDEYRRRFIDTFCMMGGSVFEYNRAGKIVNELQANVQAMCQLMTQQGGGGFWGGGDLSKGNNVANSANTIKNNLNSSRSGTMANYMKQFAPMKLTNTTRQAVTLNADVEGAQLFVNDVHVPYSDFNGHLFAPVTLRAEAPAGYVFAGWKKGSSILSTDEEISLPSGSTVKLTATFTKLDDNEIAALGITPVRINEVSADDGIYVNDLFKRTDWIELYNTTDKDIDTEGMLLTYRAEGADKTSKYEIKKDSLISTVIPAHGYLIIWCDKKKGTSQLHAPFKIDKDGGDLQLTAADESWTDRLLYTAHKSDQTVGRYPDGSNQVYVMNLPTIAKANAFSSYTISTADAATTGVRDIMAEQRPADDRIYNLRGQLVQGTLKPGIYIRNGRKVVIK